LLAEQKAADSSSAWGTQTILSKDRFDLSLSIPREVSLKGAPYTTCLDCAPVLPAERVRKAFKTGYEISPFFG
jgi:hypothetical protein